MYQNSVAMTEDTHSTLAGHLLRADGQEDICLATYTVSTGAHRTSRLVHTVELPDDRDRLVHGNATINGPYVLRVAASAARLGQGLVLLHSHPGGAGWQALSGPDTDAERSYAGLAQHVTGLPLVGMTLAGDSTWSTRVWVHHMPAWAGSVRRVGTNLVTSFNDDIVQPAVAEEAQLRTISAWGERLHRDITRLRVLVVGVGSVGLDVVQRLAATGMLEIGVMDFDHTHEVNRDRMIGVTRRDARFRRPKVDVAERLGRRAATSPDLRVYKHQTSICAPEGRQAALDYDVIFSCVDRPWPRAVLNVLAYADLIPVIDGGIAIDSLDNGGIRGATRRAHTATPGRACLACIQQIDMSDVALEMGGHLDDPEYIRRAGRAPLSGRPNVAALCAAVSASQLEQFVSLIARPAGQGVPKALRFNLALHHLEHLPFGTHSYCNTESQIASGDHRVDLCRTEGPWARRHDDPVSAVRRWSEKTLDTIVERILNN